MKYLISFMEVIENNLIMFIAAIFIVVVFLVALVLLVILRKKKQKQAENPDEYLIRKTLLEEETEFSTEGQDLKEEEKIEEPKEEQKVIVKEEKKEEVVVKQQEVQEEIKEQPKEEVVLNKPEETPQYQNTFDKKKRAVNGKYEVYFDGQKYFYILKASNGEKLVTSELYSSKDSVLSAIEVVRKSVVDGKVIVSSDKRGLYQFTLLAKNHRKLCMSANYQTEKGALNAADSFKRFADISPVVEIKEQVEPLKEELIIDVNDKKGGKLGIVEENGKYRYYVKASNGVVLLNSDTYRNADFALNGLNTFREALKSGKFFVEKDKRDFYQFKLYSSAGRLIVAGESYPTKQNAINACLALCSYVNLATLVDL